MTTGGQTRKQPMERIFGLLRTGRSYTRQEISAKLALSMPTVLQNVTGLLESGILEESGVAQSSGGRRAHRLCLRAGAGQVLGIEVAVRHTTLVVADLLGTVRYSRQLPLPFQDTLEWYGALRAALDSFVQGQTNVLGGGVSFPGTFDGPGMVSSHIFGLAHMGLERFQRCVSFPVIFENDANCACRAEQRTAEDSYFYVSLNETVGGAVMLNGRLLAGNTFQAGEVGHVLLFPGGRQCYCGKRGCADAYLSPRRLTDEPLDAFLVRPHTDGEQARWDAYLEHLAILLTNLRMLYNLDLIVGGEVGAVIGPSLPTLRAKAACYDRFARDIDYIYPCSCRERACAAGAARLALDHFGSRVLLDKRRKKL